MVCDSPTSHSTIGIHFAVPIRTVRTATQFLLGLWPAWIALACGLSVTWVAWLSDQGNIERQLRLEFEADTSQIRSDLSTRIAGYTQTLRAAAALFATSNNVTREDWHAYVKGLKLERSYPAIQAVAFARSVSGNDLESLVGDIRKGGVTEFAMRPPGRRDRYVINVFAEPFTGLNIKALGYDMWQDADRRETMQHASASGEPMITGRTTLRIDEQSNPVPAFIMFMPVVRKPGDSEYGYVLSPFRMPALMADLLGSHARGISISVNDGAQARPDNFFYRSHEAGGHVAAKFTHSEQMLIGGRTWTLTYASEPGFEARAGFGRSTTVLVGGGLASFLLFGLVGSLATTRMRALGLARQMTSSLRTSEESLAITLHSISDAVIATDVSGRVTRMNQTAEHLCGWALTEARERPLSEVFRIVGSDTRQAIADPVQSVIKSGKVAGPAKNAVLLARDGQEYQVTDSAAPIRSAAGDIVGVVLVFRDVTEKFKSDAALQESEARFRVIVDHAPEAIVVFDFSSRQIVDVNPMAEQLFGCTRERLLGGELERFYSAHQPDGRDVRESFESNCRRAIAGDDLIAERCIHTDDDRDLICEVRLTRLPYRGQQLVRGSYIDITERKRAENQIQALAFSDPLTGLPNRRLLMDRLEQAMAAASRYGHQSALMFIDLDDFKTLNDTLGHERGDLLLKQIAQRLLMSVREGDSVARLSGDEFVVLLENLSRNTQEAAKQAEAVGAKVLDALGQPYQLGGHGHHSTASIGVTLFGDALRENIEEPLKRAELAMYQAKRAGRNGLRFFEPEMRTAVNTRATLEADLREAVTRSQFLVFYQPQWGDGARLSGVEALVRWRHPERGAVSPAEFIPVAEASGLILPLGRWVLKTVCKQLAAWASCPELADLTIAANVSAREFRQPDFVEVVMTILEATGANPRRLKLELTESVLVDNVEDVIIKMSALKAMGVGFSLDDFGTGYSSLSYLKRLPLDQLKIDQSFVRDILIDPNDAAIAKMVVALADTLGLDAIAEGIETKEQRDFLAALGCLNYQGYLYSRPLPIEEFEAFATQV